MVEANQILHALWQVVAIGLTTFISLSLSPSSWRHSGRQQVEADIAFAALTAFATLFYVGWREAHNFAVVIRHSSLWGCWILLFLVGCAAELGCWYRLNRHLEQLPTSILNTDSTPHLQYARERKQLLRSLLLLAAMAVVAMLWLYAISLGRR